MIMTQNILPYLMPLRIRVRTLRRLSELSPLQILIIVIAALIGVGVSMLLTKKKSEWNGTINKLITIAVMIPLMALAIILL